MLNPFAINPPSFSRGKGYWKKQYPFTFDPSWINSDIASLNSLISKYTSVNDLQKVDLLKTLLSSLRFWKENNAVIESIFSFTAFASNISRGDYSKIVFINDMIGENLHSPSSFTDNLSSVSLDLDNIISHYKRYYEEITYLKENLLEVSTRLFEIQSFPIDLFKMIPSAVNAKPEFLFTSICAIAPDVKRVNQLMSIENVSLVLSAIIDIRSHLNIINDDSREGVINGINKDDFHAHQSVNDSIYIGRLYEEMKAALSKKYYSIPLAVDEPERLPLKLFINNIDVLFDIKVNVINKIAPIIDAYKSYFIVNANYVNITFQKYFTELAEMFYADGKLSLDWITQVEVMSKDMDDKVYSLRGKLSQTDYKELSLYQFHDLSSFDDAAFTFSKAHLYHPLIVEAFLLKRCKEVYDKILFYKRPLMQLVATYDRLMMKQLKRDEYAEMMYSQLTNAKLLTEDEFKDIKPNDLYQAALKDNDILFPIMAPTSSLAAFLVDFYKLKDKAQKAQQGSLEHRIIAYAVFKMMKTAPTWDDNKERFVEPYLEELNKSNPSVFIDTFLENAEPYMPMNPDDLIDFSDKYDLLPSFSFDAFVAKKVVIDDFFGYPRGIVQGYLSYLSRVLGGDNSITQDFLKVVVNSELQGDVTIQRKNYIDNTTFNETVSKIAAIFDPAIAKFPEVKAMYKRVGEFLKNPTNGLLNIDGYWQKVHDLSKVNGIPFIKCGYYPSDVAKAKSDWANLKTQIIQGQQQAQQDFGNEVFGFFKTYEATGNDVATGTFAPLLNKGLQ